MADSILICRDRARSQDMEEAFRQRGFNCTFFSTFKFRELPDVSTVQSAFGNLESSDALIFSSVFGVRFFKTKLIRMKPNPAINLPKIIAVGKKTAGLVRQKFPEVKEIFTVERLQEALDQIASEDTGLRHRVLHFTSKQSLHNIRPEVPENLELFRVPLYETIPDYSHGDAEIQKIRDGRFDVIFFGSPTAFDFFLQLTGEKPLRSARLLAAMGKTTAAHITAAGFPAPVTPVRPNAELLAEAVRSYLSRNGASQNSTERE